MGVCGSFTIFALGLLVVVSTTVPVGSSCELSSEKYYQRTCPNLLPIVRSVVRSALAKEPRLGASILRLFFHDCFVNGCDGSVLLDDTGSFIGEKTAGPNNGSLRGFEVIDAIKSKVEALCPNLVSCADLLAIASRDSVVLLGGPNWEVKLGRRDSRTANLSLANSALPGPSSSLDFLISNFQAQGLSVTDMVALSGGHTIGKSRCISFRAHIYNDTNIDPSFAKRKQSICPQTSGSGDNNVDKLDIQSPNYFDNSYFKNLINKRGFLHSDQVLFNGGSTDSLVRTYSLNPERFASDFVAAMIRMGDIKPLVPPNGEIRNNCRRVN